MKPRNSSTNMRSLSNRLTTLQREVTPRLRMTGTPVVSTTATKQVYLVRKVNYNLTFSAATKTVTPADLATALPDGARLFKVKATNVTTRNVRMTVPSDTGLFVRGSKTNSEVATLTNEQWAPLSRFPTVSLDVPDTLSNALDTNDATLPLFAVTAGDWVSGAVTVTLRLTYQTMV